MWLRWSKCGRALCLVASLALGACATQRSTYLESGARGYLITCGGFFNRWESCLVKAGQICRGEGYETIRSVEYDRVLLVACKTPGATASTASR